MRRIVSVWLPDWPITVWSRAAGRARPDGPFVLTERTGRGLVLAAANGAARALGLYRGQSHADACSIAPELASAPAEPDAAAAALRKLALWAERYSPCVAIDEAAGHEGLTLDVSGAAHLFGGEAALLADIEARLAKADAPAKPAMADTAGGAWALARFSDMRLAEAGRTREALAPLPVEALRIGEDALGLLRRLGLKRIGDLYGLPRSGLARRFPGEAGMALVRRLDQALGVEPEPLKPVRPAARYRSWRLYPEPLIDLEGLAHALSELLEALARQLERDGQGARRIAVHAFRSDGQVQSLEAGLSTPSAAPAHLMRLLKERGLERIDLGFGADALMVEARQAERLTLRQGDLAQGRTDEDAEGLAALIDRLEAKLGEGAVRRPTLCDSHIPERSERWTKAGPRPPSGEGVLDERLRPILLLDPPEPVEALAEVPDNPPRRFVWRRVTRSVVLAEGPERIAPEWWRPQTGPRPERTRDYYRVEDEVGRRYWLFREGLFEPPDPDRLPTWWLHGVFP